MLSRHSNRVTYRCLISQIVLLPSSSPVPSLSAAGCPAPHAYGLSKDMCGHVSECYLTRCSCALYLRIHATFSYCTCSIARVCTSLLVPDYAAAADAQSMLPVAGCNYTDHINCFHQPGIAANCVRTVPTCRSTRFATSPLASSLAPHDAACMRGRAPSSERQLVGLPQCLATHAL